MTIAMPVWLSPILGLIGTLLGGYLVLRGQEAGRLFQAQRDDNQLVRDRAQEIFSEINSIKQQQVPSLISIVKLQHALEDTEKPEVVPFPNISKLKSLIAVYFPSILIHIEGFDKTFTGKDGSGEIDFSDMKAAHAKIVARTIFMSEKLTKTLFAVEDALLSELQKLPPLGGHRNALKWNMF